MTRLFGFTCNQPERLAEALEPARQALIAEPVVARWGLGYIQSSEVLLSRTPRRSTAPIDFYPTLARIHSDYVIGHAAGDDGLAGNANTQPFRYRLWLFAQEAELADRASLQNELLEHIHPFLRRTVKGKTLAEHVFLIFLSRLHDSANIHDVNLPLAETKRALASAIDIVQGIAGDADHELGNAMLTNGRSMVAARLGRPLYMRNLNLPVNPRERGKSDRGNTFRGVLATSSATHPGAGFEEIPDRSVLMVSRDVRIEVTSLAG